MGQGERDHSSDVAAAPAEHHFYHDMAGDDCLSTTILTALAEVRGVDVTALQLTLHDHVDTDALDAIFAPRLDGTPREGSHVELSLDRHSITVHGDGHIVVTGSAAPRTA